VLYSADCIIGIGANLGERECTFAWALEKLAGLGEIRALSNIYENPAVGGPPQPDYLNAAVRLLTPLSPFGLLESTQGLERMAGRERTVHWGPRTLDLDLLWIADQELDTPTLQLPHPRLLERAFALLPLVEVAGSATDPRTHLAYAVALEAHQTDEMRLHSVVVGPPWRWQRMRTRSARLSETLIAY
jgi:2-amino-4-hydroxy-6-hydroxymethyldihydropteridine diphosphokinase